MSEEKSVYRGISSGGTGGSLSKIDSKDGKIVRIRPMRWKENWDEEWAKTRMWEMEARGHTFKCPEKSMPPHNAYMYVWITEDTYDHEFVETHTVGFEKLKAYIIGEEDGVPKTLIDEAGSPEAPVVLAIGHYAIPMNVSNALGTMSEGETRTVKAGFRRKGEKPQRATYAVHLVRRLEMDAFEEERLNGGKCSCGSHRLRDSLSHSHSHSSECECSQHRV